jgi:periplasmic protein CpxP/Spy
MVTMLDRPILATSSNRPARNHPKSAGATVMKYRLVAMTAGLLLTMPFNPFSAQASELIATFPALQDVELTPSQRQQLSVLSNKTLAEVRAILNTEQKAKFNHSLATGAGIKKSLLGTNLSLPQKFQLRNTLAPKQQQVEAILTPAQKQQVQQNLSAQR